jgi:hypothetical protein
MLVLFCTLLVFSQENSRRANQEAAPERHDLLTCSEPSNLQLISSVSAFLHHTYSSGCLALERHYDTDDFTLLCLPYLNCPV